MPRGPKPGTMPKRVHPKGQPAPNNGRIAGLTELRKYGAKELTEKMHALMKCTKAELKQVVEDDESDMLTAALARIMLQAAENGDITKLNFIVERVAGPVPKTININADVNNTNNSTLTGLSDEDLREMQAILRKASPSKEET